jgi:hypothetical protein
MAKRIPPPTSSDDAAAAKPKRPSRARVKAPAGSPSAPGSAADAQGAKATEVSSSKTFVPPPPAANASHSATAAVSMSSEPSEEDIRVRAYHKFLHREGGAGSDWDDWFGAEKELRRTFDTKKRQLS